MKDSNLSVEAEAAAAAADRTSQASFRFLKLAPSGFKERRSAVGVSFMMSREQL